MTNVDRHRAPVREVSKVKKAPSETRVHFGYARHGH